MDLDDTVCYCFHVTKRKIVNYIRIQKPRVPSQISNCNSAGTGCGWCVSFLKKYFEDAKAGTSADETVSAQDYAQQRGEYLRAGHGKPPSGAIPPPPPDH